MISYMEENGYKAAIFVGWVELSDSRRRYYSDILTLQDLKDAILGSQNSSNSFQLLNYIENTNTDGLVVLGYYNGSITRTRVTLIK